MVARAWRQRVFFSICETQVCCLTYSWFRLALQAHERIVVVAGTSLLDVAGMSLREGASARAQFQCIVHFLMLPDACCLCMLLVQVDEAGASSVVDDRDDSLVQADAASAGMVKVRVLFSSFDQFHVHACACRYISCSTPLVLLLYSLRAHVCVHTVHPAVALRPCANFESMTHEHAS